MNRQKKREERRKQVARNRMMILLVAILIVLGFAFMGNIISAEANDPNKVTLQKYYKSIEIQAGDSLWKIAEEHYTDDYESIQEYVKEIKELNALSSDTIHEGRHLMIGYYGI